MKQREMKHRECRNIEHKGGKIQDRVSKGEERKTEREEILGCE